MKKLSSNIKASLIVACYNEKKHINKCLDSLLDQDYRKAALEIIVIDGGSEDGTLNILEDYEKNGFIKLFHNKKTFPSAGRNIGIKKSSGEYIIIISAHSVYPKDYVRKCLASITKYSADNVGGIIKAKSHEKNLTARAVLATYISSFGVGGATFRKNISEPREVDTVFGGCYRRNVFNRVGMFDEKLLRGQDIEFNLRLKRAGGKNILVPSIVSDYYPKTKFREFLSYSFTSGKWPIITLKLTKQPLKLMHYIPGLFFLGLSFGWVTYFLNIIPLWYIYLSVLVLYLMLSLYYSIYYSIKKKDYPLTAILPFFFFLKHYFYGMGSLVGVFSGINKR